MAERAKHLFQFPADAIARAARDEAAYHEDRRKFWENELDAATTVVEQTAGVKVTRVQQTGGWRPDVVINYGDPAAYQRMGEAGGKIQKHRAAQERYLSDGQLYGTQGARVYDLDGDDVAHFRLNGRERDD